MDVRGCAEGLQRSALRLGADEGVDCVGWCLGGEEGGETAGDFLFLLLVVVGLNEV